MKPGTVRIIGGRWRGRKLPVACLPDLRPTPDRVRETLFNWLQAMIADASCLDLFAGSGALGLEALSRGALKVCFIEQSSIVVESLRKVIKSLDVHNATILQGQALEVLGCIKETFNVVFLDPPFKSDLLYSSCNYLEAHHLLASTAYIYLEAEQKLQIDLLPPNWTLLKQKKAGHVYYHLAKREQIT